MAIRRREQRAVRSFRLSAREGRLADHASEELEVSFSEFVRGAVVREARRILLSARGGLAGDQSGETAAGKGP